MLLLPYENIVYTSRLTKEQLIEKLYDSVDAETTTDYRWSSATTEKLFQGKIEGSGFRFRRIIFYKNSFLPEITGHMRRDGDRTVIEVKMNLSIAVLIFFGLMFFSFGGFIFLAASELKDSVLIVGAIYAVVMLAFKFESFKAKAMLSEIFEAENNQQNNIA